MGCPGARRTGAHSYCHFHGDSNTNCIAYADCDVYAYIYPYVYTFPYTYRHAHGNAKPHAHAHPHTDRKSYAYKNPYIDSYANRESVINRDTKTRLEQLAHAHYFYRWRMKRSNTISHTTIIHLQVPIRHHLREKQSRRG